MATPNTSNTVIDAMMNDSNHQHCDSQIRYGETSKKVEGNHQKAQPSNGQVSIRDQLKNQFDIANGSDTMERFSKKLNADKQSESMAGNVSMVHADQKESTAIMAFLPPAVANAKSTASKLGGIPTTIPPATTAILERLQDIPTTAPVGWPKEAGMIFGSYEKAIEKTSEPTYVNAKQYERIMHRRKTRAILEAHYEKLRQARGKRDTPYKHKSRHLHSIKRPRNSKGYFMSNSELKEYYRQHPKEDPKNATIQSADSDDNKPKTVSGKETEI